MTSTTAAPKTYDHSKVQVGEMARKKRIRRGIIERSLRVMRATQGQEYLFLLPPDLSEEEILKRRQRIEASEAKAIDLESAKRLLQARRFVTMSLEGRVAILKWIEFAEDNLDELTEILEFLRDEDEFFELPESMKLLATMSQHFPLTEK